MPELLDDVWFTRDLPVLRAIARLVDGPEYGGNPYLGQVVPASGLAKPEVSAAARALVSAGYVEALTNYAGEIVRFTGSAPTATGREPPPASRRPARFPEPPPARERSWPAVRPRGTPSGATRGNRSGAGSPRKGDPSGCWMSA